MKQLTGMDVQECTASTTSLAISKPCDCETSSVTLKGDQPTTLLFTLDDVKGYDVQSDGSLLISFKDNTSLSIPNFKDLAAANYAVKLEDGTLIEFAKLMEEYGTPMAVSDNKKIAVDFPSEDIKSIEQNADGKLVVTLKNGEEHIVNYDEGTETSLMFADCGTQNLAGLLKEFSVAKVDGLNEVEPAAGESKKAVAKPVDNNQTAQLNAEQLADIEPAAGGPAGGNRNTGAGFGSRIDGRTIGPANDVGPIGPTDLAFDIPGPNPVLPFAELPTTTITPPSVSVNGGVDFACIPEDSAGVAIPVFAIGNGSGQETMVVTISGLPTAAGWTVDLSGLVTGGAAVSYDPATGIATINLPANTDLGGFIRLTPPANSDIDGGDITLTAVATEPSSGISSSATDTAYARVDAIADGTDVTATGDSVTTTSSANIDVTVALRDTDGSEVIQTITITGIPADVTLSAGTRNVDGSYTLTPAQLTGLTATSNGYAGTFTGTVTVASRDVPTDLECDLTNNSASDSANFTVTFNPGVVPPTVSINNNIDFVCIPEDSTGVDVPVMAVGNGSGQETMVVTISGLPTAPGWNVDVSGITGGTVVYDAVTGTVTVSLPANTDLGGSIRLTPPADSDVDAGNLTISATVTEPSTGDTATATDTTYARVDAIADGTDVTASGDSVDINSSADIDVTAQLRDIDGSETIETITITGIPANVTLSAGVRNADGSYTLTPAQLNGLTATSNGFVGTFTGRVTVASQDNPTDLDCDLTNNNASDAANFTVTFSQDVLPPTVSINNGIDFACIPEDSAGVNINVSAVGNGSNQETMVVTISGLPTEPGWTVSIAGVTGASSVSSVPGSFTFTLPANTDLGGFITLTPPADSDIDAGNITISATVTEPLSGQTATATDTTYARVDAIADGTDVTAQGDSVTVSSSADIDVTAQLRDIDGSETIESVTINGIPAGVTLSAGVRNADGSWTLTPAQLNGLTATSNGFTGTFTGRVVVASRDNPTDLDCNPNNNTARDGANFTVTFNPDVVPPTVSINNNIDFACIPEDSAGVNIPVSAVGNGSGAETMVVTISGLPTAAGWGVNLSGITGGTVTYNAATGVATINLPANTDLGGFIRLTPPANSDIDAGNITISATVTEPSTGDTATASDTAYARVDAVADGVDLTAQGESVDINSSADIDVTAQLRDRDGSETIETITITGVPSGVTLSAGVRNADGSYTLTPAQLNGLTATSNGYVGTFTGRVTVASQDNPTDRECDLTNNNATNAANFTVTFTQNVIPPTVSINDGLDFACIPEDSTGVNINVSAVGNGSGQETMEVTISGLPTAAGWTVDVSRITGGTVTYNAATGVVVVTLPANTDLGGFIRLAPPADSDIDAGNLTISATITEPASGLTATATDTTYARVDAIADGTDVTAQGDSVTVSSSADIDVTAQLRDIDGSETIETVTITGIPASVTLSAGVRNADGSYTLTPAQLNGLTATSNGFTGTFTGRVTVASRDNPTDRECDLTNNTARDSANFTVTFNPDVVPPTVSVNGGLDFACIPEDSSGVNVSVSAIGNGSGAETMTVTISGLPTAAGWGVDLSGITGGTVNYNAATGVATINLPANTNLGGFIRFTPPANSDVDAGNLTLTATVTEPSTGQTATSTDTSYVRVDAIADGVNLTADGDTVTTTGSADIDIDVSLRDRDGSESIQSVTITGIPTGVTLSAGTRNADGSWTLTPAQLNGLTATSNGYAGTFTGTVTVASRDNPTDLECNVNNNNATDTANFTVTFNPDVVPPTVSVNGGLDFACIPEDSSGVNVSVSAIGNGSGAETMTVTISGLPTAAGWGVDLSGITGGTVNYNAATGVATINLPANTNLGGFIRFTPPANSDVDAGNLTLTATVTEPSTGQTATSTDTSYVRVDAIADGTDVTAQGESVTVGSSANIDVTAQLRDTDGSETIQSVTITGIPAAVTLSAGTRNADGSWTLTPAQLNGLTATSTGFVGTFTASVAVASRDNPTDLECNVNNNNATDTANFTVSFTQNVVPPTVSINTNIDTVCIPEDSTGVNIPVSAIGNGSTSETMVVTISGLPTAAGWQVDLSGITGGTVTYNAATGVATITLPANTDMGGSIRLAPPANSDVDAGNITISATVTEPSSGQTATSNDTAFARVDAIADGLNITTNAANAYFFDVEIERTGNTNTVEFSAAFNFSYRDNDGSESITSIVAVPGSAAAQYLSNLQVTQDGNGNFILTGTLTWTGDRFNPPDFTADLRITTTDTPTDQECDLTNNTITQPVSIAFDFTNVGTPLVMDLDGNGIQTMTIGAGVMFDMTNDGRADRTAWVAGNDGFLTLDRNHDGLINNQAEMFGNSTNHQDGFAHLATYDINNDGVINDADSVFADLLVWRDINSDGVSQADEMFSMADLNITSISLNSTSSFEDLGADTGVVIGRSTFTTSDGETHDIADIAFTIEEADDVSAAISDFVIGGTDPQPSVIAADPAVAIPASAPDNVAPSEVVIVDASLTPVQPVPPTDHLESASSVLVGPQTVAVNDNAILHVSSPDAHTLPVADMLGQLDQISQNAA